MEKKRDSWRFFIKNGTKALAVSSLMLGGGGAHVWGAEWIFGPICSAASHVLGGAAQSLTTTAWAFLEKEKTYENLFNEAIANSKRSEAEEVVRKVFCEIRLGLKELNIQTASQLRDKVNGNSNVEKYNATFQIWYTKYRLGMLMLDYTDAFRTLCESSCQSIFELVPRVNSVTRISEKEVLSQKSYLERFEKEIKDRKTKIGAKLYYNYPYERGGGMRDRYVKHSQTQLERKRMWGVNYFDLQSNISYEEVFELLPSTLTENVCVNNVRKAYQATLKLLSSGPIICSEKSERSWEILEEFMEQFTSMFPGRKLSICQLDGYIFEDEEREFKSKNKFIQIEKRSSSSNAIKARSGSNTPVNRSQSISVPSKKLAKQLRDDFPVSPHSRSSHNPLLEYEESPKSVPSSKRNSVKTDDSYLDEDLGYGSQEDGYGEDRGRKNKKELKTAVKEKNKGVVAVGSFEDEDLLGEVGDEYLKGDDEFEVKQNDNEGDVDGKLYDSEEEVPVKQKSNKANAVVKPKSNKEDAVVKPKSNKENAVVKPKGNEEKVVAQPKDDEEKVVIKPQEKEVEAEINADDYDLNFDGYSFSDEEPDPSPSSNKNEEKLLKENENKDK